MSDPPTILTPSRPPGTAQLDPVAVVPTNQRGRRLTSSLGSAAAPTSQAAATSMTTTGDVGDYLRLQCPICGKRFEGLRSSGMRSNYQRHLLVHSGERPYACLDCPASFTTSQNLKRHVAAKHSSSTTPAIEWTDAERVAEAGGRDQPQRQPHHRRRIDAGIAHRGAASGSGPRETEDTAILLPFELDDDPFDDGASAAFMRVGESDVGGSVADPMGDESHRGSLWNGGGSTTLPRSLPWQQLVARLGFDDAEHLHDEPAGPTGGSSVGGVIIASSPVWRHHDDGDPHALGGVGAAAAAARRRRDDSGRAPPDVSRVAFWAMSTTTAVDRVPASLLDGETAAGGQEDPQAKGNEGDAVPSKPSRRRRRVPSEDDDDDDADAAGGDESVSSTSSCRNHHHYQDRTRRRTHQAASNAKQRQVTSVQPAASVVVASHFSDDKGSRRVEVDLGLAPGRPLGGVHEEGGRDVSASGGEEEGNRGGRMRRDGSTDDGGEDDDDDDGKEKDVGRGPVGLLHHLFRSGDDRAAASRASDGPAQCTVCGRRFRHYTSLQYHTRQMHSSDGRGIGVECDRCCAWLSSRAKLTRHLKRHCPMRHLTEGYQRNHVTGEHYDRGSAAAGGETSATSTPSVRTPVTWPTPMGFPAWPNPTQPPPTTGHHRSRGHQGGAREGDKARGTAGSSTTAVLSPTEATTGSVLGFFPWSAGAANTGGVKGGDHPTTHNAATAAVEVPTRAKRCRRRAAVLRDGLSSSESPLTSGDSSSD